MRRKLLLAILIGLAVLIGGGAAIASQSAGGATDPPPPAWVNADGTLNADAMPAFIPAVADDGVAGYISSADTIPAPGSGASAAIPVYAQPDDHSPIVGYLG